MLPRRISCSLCIFLLSAAAELGCGSGGPGGTGGTTTTTSQGGSGGSGGALMVCIPGSVESCYSGPTGTEAVGRCKSGTRTCAADGSGFGPCQGEVLPVQEDCATPIDD